MHWYKKNIGDYSKKAGRLSMLQHGAYTLLIDSCYDRERFPTIEEAVDWAWASSKEEIEAVEFVLKRFFTNEDGFYVQNRIREELAEYHVKAEKNKRIAEEREAKRKEKLTERARIVYEAPPNQEPVTSNQEPVTNKKIVLATQPDAQLPATAGAKAPAKANKGTRLATDWKLPAAYGNWALEKGLSRERVLTEAERFRNYWVAKSGRDAAKLDWEATWRNWILKAVDDQGSGKKTYAEQAQDFKDKQAEKFYQPLLNATPEELEKWGLA